MRGQFVAEFRRGAAVYYGLWALNGRRPGRNRERGKEMSANRWVPLCRAVHRKVVGRTICMNPTLIGRPGGSTATLRPWRGQSVEAGRRGDHEESQIGERLLGMRGKSSTTTMRPWWHRGHSRNEQLVSCHDNPLLTGNRHSPRKRACLGVDGTGPVSVAGSGWPGSRSIKCAGIHLATREAGTAG